MSMNLVVSAASRFVLGVQGNFIPYVLRRQHTNVLPPGDEHDVVRLKLTVYVPRFSSNIYRYPEFDFPLSRLPELRQVIGNAIRGAGDEESILRGDDHEVLGFLAEHVTAFVNDFVERTLANGRGLYMVFANLFLGDEAPGAAGPPAATESAPSQTSTVTYRNRQQQQEEEESRAADEDVVVITETSCPICLQDFVDGEQVQLTHCGHPFHHRCLEQWLHHRAHCPLCRSAMPPL